MLRCILALCALESIAMAKPQVFRVLDSNIESTAPDRLTTYTVTRDGKLALTVEKKTRDGAGWKVDYTEPFTGVTARA